MAIPEGYEAVIPEGYEAVTPEISEGTPEPRSPLGAALDVAGSQMQNVAEGAMLGWRDEAEALLSSQMQDIPYGEAPTVMVSITVLKVADEESESITDTLWLFEFDT